MVWIKHIYHKAIDHAFSSESKSIDGHTTFPFDVTNNEQD